MVYGGVRLRQTARKLIVFGVGLHHVRIQFRQNAVAFLHHGGEFAALRVQVLLRLGGLSALLLDGVLLLLDGFEFFPQAGDELGVVLGDGLHDLRLLHEVDDVFRVQDDLQRRGLAG